MFGKVNVSGLPGSTISFLNKVDDAYLKALRTVDPPLLWDYSTERMIEYLWNVCYAVLGSRSFYEKRFYENIWTKVADTDEYLVVKKTCNYKQVRLKPGVYVGISHDYNELWYLKKEKSGLKLDYVKYE